MGYEQLMQGVVVVLTTPILWETHRHPVMFPQAPNWYPVGIPSESLLTTFTPMEPCNPMGNPTCHLLESNIPPRVSHGNPMGIHLESLYATIKESPSEYNWNPIFIIIPVAPPYPMGTPKACHENPMQHTWGPYENDKMNPSKVLSGSSQSIFTKIHVEPHTAWEYQTPAMGIPRGTPWGIQWGIQVLLRCSSS